MEYAIQETNAKSILVRSRLPGVDYVINAYTGCVHGCAYCYANFMGKFSGHREPWGRYTDIKINAPLLLKKEMARSRPGRIMMSSVTDPYNQLENKYGLTRQILEILLDYQWPLSILTKSSLIVRDIDLLKEFKNCDIGFSFMSLDDKVIRDFEPHTSLASDRIRAISQLVDNGLSVYAFVAPILPYISNLPDIFRRLSQTKINLIYCDGFNYRTGSRESAVVSIVKDKYPQLWPKFKIAYKNGVYWQKMAKEIRNLASHYSLETKVFFG